MELKLHRSDEEMDDYVLRRLSPAKTDEFENHLMLCGSCQERLELFNNYCFDLRAEALLEPEQGSLFAWRKDFGWQNNVRWLKDFGLNLGTMPAFSAAFAGIAVVAIAAGVFSASGRTNLAPSASLQLTAMRGEIVSAAPARETDLTLGDLPPGGGPFSVEVVNETGTRQWSGPVSGNRPLRIEKSLKPGTYFVRLYGPDRQVVHEYGFRVRD